MQAPPGGPEVPGAVYFNANKCCTYSPRLHAFLAGRILDDAQPGAARARAEVERRIGARAGVTPRGILPPRSYWSLYGVSTFGRSDRLRCPWFEAGEGRCGVWRHREAVCATWFCKFERGAAGAALWDALGDLLRHIENSLVFYCAQELDVGPEALAALLADERREADAEELDGRDPDARHAAAWGRWAGREREFFRACARAVEPMRWPDVERVIGAEGRALAAVARAQFVALSAEPGAGGPLRLGGYHLLGVHGQLARIRTYRSLDPLDVPLPLLAALPRFDGRPTDAVLREIASLDGLDVTPDLLRTLADFELLVPAGAGAAAPDRAWTPRPP